MNGFDWSETDMQIKQLAEWEKFEASGSVADYLEYKRICKNAGGRKEETSLYAGEDGRNCTEGAKI